MIFIFEPPDFSRILSPDFFSSFFVGRSAQKNPLGKSPAKTSKIYTTKIPDKFLQRAGPKKLIVPKICVFGCVVFSGALCSPG